MSIDIRNIRKDFGAFTALNGVSLELPTGELVALLGPSGCGKTTLLRIIAGLEFADAGSILFHGEDATTRDPRERQVGFVFQHYALFRHMSVFENVAFGLRVKPRHERLPEARIAAKVHELLNLVQLDWLADRYPRELSGGQRQRIALARALAVEPKVLLLDEPFGALDTKVRKELRRWLRNLHDELHVTSVFVTHDQDEALEVADRVVVMNKGEIEQIGAPDEVYDSPASAFVYQFLGNVNLFHGRVQEGWAQVGEARLPAPGTESAADAPVLAFARPHEIDVARESRGDGVIPARVKQVRMNGPMVRLELAQEGSGQPLEVELTRERYRQDEFAPGDAVFLKPGNLRIFPARSGASTESRVAGSIPNKRP
jgi:sulfate transport system ATP-binding protein